MNGFMLTSLVLGIVSYPIVKSNYPNISQMPGSSGFNIYCTSNQDGTGSCNRVDNNEVVDCLMIPGGIINCKEKGESAIQCVLYSSTLNSQAYFYCTRRTQPGIRNNRINPDRFTPSSTPLSNPLTPTTNSNNPIQDQFSDPLNQ